MTDHHGSFCWYELMTPDPDAAAAFYGAVLGWTSEPAVGAPVPYTLCLAGSTHVAGMLDLPPGVPMPVWVGHVRVDDLDAVMEQARSLGGSIVHGPMELPHGRSAMLADPQGAHMVLMQPAGGQVPPPAIPTEPGFGAWRELLSNDADGALQFYTTLFGWTGTTAIPMGEMGTYQLFAHHGQDIGGMMPRPTGMPVSAWGYYFEVDGVDAAIERIAAAGGTVVRGPIEVPGGQWIAQATDPQGGFFAVVGSTL